jgi:hypothetical protein
MGNMPTPRADALRAQREARYEQNQKRMKEESKAATIGGLKDAVAKTTEKVKAKPAKKKRRA